MLVAIPGIRDVGLTTNGILLADQAQPLYDAGLRRLNVRLDTLDPGRFRELTRRDGLEKVLAGLDAGEARPASRRSRSTPSASAAFTEHDVVPLARYCREHGFEMRFIEYMPIGAEAWERDKVFFAHEILELHRARGRRRCVAGELRPDRPGDGLRLRRRRRPGRHHRVGVAAVLP